MKILIDGDACPVKGAVIEEACRRRIPVVLVSSFSHYSDVQLPEGVERIYVDSGSDAADFKIMGLADQGDVLVTQDYGLASLALHKGLTVLHHKGFLYTRDNIDLLLESRYLSAMIRKSGKRTKGPKPFTRDDMSKFIQLLVKTLDEIALQDNA